MHNIFTGKAGIGAKVSAAMAIAVATLFSAFVMWTTSASEKQAEADAIHSVTEQSRLLETAIGVLDRGLRQQVAASAAVFQFTLAGQFALAAEPVDVNGRQVPSLTLDGRPVALDFALADRFTSLTGAYATIFVRDGDDFIRVTTSHKKENGQRAVGTVLDHGHPGYALLMRGQEFAGSANLFGGQYMTHYRPILGADKRVIGVLYVGLDFSDALRGLGEGIKAVRLGQEGGFYVVNARPGKELGRLLIHPRLEGTAMLGARDADGAAFVATMLAQGSGVLHYTEAASGGKPARRRVAAFRTIKDWQMMVAGDAYLDEITAGAARQRDRALLLGVVLIVTLTALLYVIIRRLVARPMAEALAAVQTVSEGDLTRTVVARSEDESGRLLRSLQTMTDRLSSVVADVRHGTDDIAAVSAEVAAGNMELSARTEQQAAALEETASSMEQMNASVRFNADNAVHAQQLAREASATASRGGEQVAQLEARMEAIKVAGQRIGDITSVVDAIAFQTNILALNAAVEAARAGEHGRGFAVVATEVRTLAQRSATAAREIKQLIGDALAQVAAGSELGGRAGATMRQVVEAIARAHRTIDEISAATQEQATGIDQINRAVVQVDQVTQQNAALVEEAAAAAQAMQARAGHLAGTVAFFQLAPGALPGRG